MPADGITGWMRVTGLIWYLLDTPIHPGTRIHPVDAAVTALGAGMPCCCCFS